MAASYRIGRWRVTLTDAGTAEVYENNTLQETIDTAAFESRSDGRPSYVPANQLATFAPLARRAIFNLVDRRVGWRRVN